MRHKTTGHRGTGIIIVLFLLYSVSAAAQLRRYTTSNAHSHNDYEQQSPFWMAYRAGFGSIEADIFLVDTVLIVAHDSRELPRKLKLETEYLIPILECLQKNGGNAYPDKGKRLQLLIDIKSDSINTLNALIILLRKYPALIQCKSLKWTISGNRPSSFLFAGYPDFITFDGVPGKIYSKEALSKISLMSDDFKKYSSWNGEGILSEKDDSLLSSAVSKSHLLNKPIRFWNAPDKPTAWQELMILKVDYINTDHIQMLKDFLNK